MRFLETPRGRAAAHEFLAACDEGDRLRPRFRRLKWRDLYAAARVAFRLAAVKERIRAARVVLDSEAW